MRRSPAPVAVVVAVVVASVAAACGSDRSILSAGNDDPAPVTAGPGPSEDTDAGPTATDPETGDSGGGPVASTTPPARATTTTAPLAALPDCPVDALDDGGGPVDITFWHGLTADNQQALIRLTDRYHAAQDRVRVNLQNQGGYRETIDKFFQSGSSGRPELVIFPEYTVRRAVDSGSLVPITACLAASGYDTSPFPSAVLAAYTLEGVQWGMPFNLSNPVLFYNRSVFEAAGLDPDRPPLDLAELRRISQQIVDSGAASYGIALDTGSDSGGGWFLEQWFANAGELYADNGNGRLAPATRVLYDGPVGVELLSYVQALIADGLAYNVGDNAGGADQFLKLADQQQPAAMAIGTSAALGTIINVVDQGLIPGITGADIGVGPLPGPSGTPTALVGGGALFVVGGHSAAQAAATWDFVTYLVSPAVQSEWVVATGYVPVRADALAVEPALAAYRDDPRYRVAYDQLVTSPGDPAQQGPILGPQREVRTVTARAVAEIFAGGEVQAALATAAEQANALLADYNARN